ncbi:hypothetical protein M758_1G243300 [Ceratodon purpureus]|nr:hypothetical protein M758_1G243300 [Ceratodon purpureus]
MSGQLTFPGTPRSRKRMNSRRLFGLGLAILLCVVTGYQLAPYKHPSREFIPDGSAGPGSAAPLAPEGGRDVLAGSAQAESLMEAVQPVDGVESPKERNHTTADDFELRQSELCNNNCNSSDIYSRLWYDARIRENTRNFQPSEDPDDPYRESIETNLVTKDFRVVIKVLAFNRLESLSRCLLSLAKADYGGDSVNIQIFVDHFRYEEIRRNGSYENTAGASGGVDNVSYSETEEPSLDPVEPSKVGGGARRLLWSLFKRAPVHEFKADVQANTTTNGEVANAPDSGHRDFVLKNGQEIVSRLSEVPGKKKELRERDSAVEVTLRAQSSIDVQHEKQEALNDDIPRQDLEMQSLGAQLGEAHEILKFVDEFWWKHGTKEIHYRSQNAGLQAQWIESWWPANLDEFAFIVEDDMEVSNLYYRFLRTVIATYYYNPEQYDPSVYGISLQRPRFVPGKGGLPLEVNSTKNLFLYPLVGTWGQLLFPKQWKEFRLWYDDHKSKGERPFLEGMVTNSWYKKLGERIWTPWFVKFAHTRGYFNLYTNFLDERALSVSHREPGSNYKKAAGPDSELVNTKEAGNDTMLWVMSPLKSLPQFDFCFRDVKIWNLARTPTELSPMLASMEMNNSVVLVNTVNVHSMLVRNWLCHMERLGMRKFVLLGDEGELISDLARRGYATVSSQLFTEAETAVTRLRRDMIAVQAVHEILNQGYSVWLTRADTVWVENPIDTGVDVSRSGDVMGSIPLDGFHPALLYIKASQGILRVWSKWVGNISVIARDLSSSNSVSHRSVWPGLRSFITSNKNCHYSALPSYFSGSFRELKSLASGKKVFLFNGIQGRNVSLVVHTLKAAGLWTIDKDLACKRVYC